MESKWIIFDATAGSAIYRRLLTNFDYQPGNLFVQTFGDGEVYHRLDTPVRGRMVIVVGDLSTNENVLATYDVANAVFDEGALGIKIVVPGLPQDRFCRQGLLKLLASVPETPLGNRLALHHWHATLDVSEYEYVNLPKPRAHAPNGTTFDCGKQGKPVLLYTGSYRYLADQMLTHGDFELGQYETEEVGGKPFFKKLKTNVRGREVVIVSGTIDDHETMELYYMSLAVALKGAAVRKKIIAYYGYGTMERKVKAGEAVKAKIRARLLSSIPACKLGNHVIMVDLHTEGIPYYMERGLQAQHVYVAKHLAAAVARQMLGLPVAVLGQNELALPDAAKVRPTLCATDAGRHKWVESMGHDIGLSTAFGRKERTANDQVEFLGVLGDVQQKDALEYDDKCGTGGTSVEACKGVRLDQYGALIQEALENGADTIDNGRIPFVKTVFACTHGVLAGQALKKLKEASDTFGFPVITYAVMSDSHPRAVALADGQFLSTMTIAYLLCQAVSDGVFSTAFSPVVRAQTRLVAA